MLNQNTFCYRCMKPGPMPKIHDWICYDCDVELTTFTVTRAEKAVIDAAIAFVTEGDDLDNADELYARLEEAVRKVTE